MPENPFSPLRYCNSELWKNLTFSCVSCALLVSPILKLPFIIIIPTGVNFSFGRTQICIVHLNAIL